MNLHLILLFFSCSFFVLLFLFSSCFLPSLDLCGHGKVLMSGQEETDIDHDIGGEKESVPNILDMIESPERYVAST